MNNFEILGEVVGYDKVGKKTAIIYIKDGLKAVPVVLPTDIDISTKNKALRFLIRNNIVEEDTIVGTICHIKGRIFNYSDELTLVASRAVLC